MSTSPNLNLSYVQPQQAQKHVTVNESFRRLDALVQLTAASATTSTPPADPQNGAIYLLPVNAGAAGDGPWAVMAPFAIAAYQDGAWIEIAPKIGLRAWVADESAMRVFDGAAWTVFQAGDGSSGPQSDGSFTELGVNASPDSVNRFSVKSDAMLLSHDDVTPGTGDARHVINKVDENHTASVVFQNGFSGRAEFGLTGSDDFSLKVSADGGAFTDAIVFDKTSGAMMVDGKESRFYCRSGDPIPVNIISDGGATAFQATRYRDAAGGAVFYGRKARGSEAAPTPALAGDTILGFRAYSYDGEAFKTGGHSSAAFLLEAAEDQTPTRGGGRIRFLTVANGSENATERLRIADDGALQMGGANTVINPARHHTLRDYSKAALPPPAPAELIYVSDAAGGAVPAFSDGASWRRVTDRSLIS